MKVHTSNFYNSLKNEEQAILENHLHSYFMDIDKDVMDLVNQAYQFDDKEIQNKAVHLKSIQYSSTGAKEKIIEISNTLSVVLNLIMNSSESNKKSITKAALKLAYVIIQAAKISKDREITSAVLAMAKYVARI